MRWAVLALAFLAACGVAGPPVPPDGAVEEVAKEGVGLVPPKGGI